MLEHNKQHLTLLFEACRDAGASLISAAAVNSTWNHIADEHNKPFWDSTIEALSSSTRQAGTGDNIVAVYSGKSSLQLHSDSDSPTDSTADSLDSSNSEHADTKWFDPAMLQFDTGPLADIAHIPSQLDFLSTNANLLASANEQDSYGLYHDLAFVQHLWQQLKQHPTANVPAAHDQRSSRTPTFVPFIVQYSNTHQPFDAKLLMSIMGAHPMIRQEVVARSYDPNRRDAAFLKWLSQDPTMSAIWTCFLRTMQHLEDYTQGAFEVRLTVEDDARRAEVQPAMIMWVGVSSHGNALGIMAKEFSQIPRWGSGSSSGGQSSGSQPTGVTTQGSADSDTLQSD